MPGLFRGVESIFRPPFSLARSLASSLARRALALPAAARWWVDRVSKSGESNGCDFICNKSKGIRDLKACLDYTYHYSRSCENLNLNFSRLNSLSIRTDSSQRKCF